MNLVARRSLEAAGILLAGDGIVGALYPERHARLWLAGPPLWRRAMTQFVDHPHVTRALALAEAALGVWLARRAGMGSSAPPRRG